MIHANEIFDAQRATLFKRAYHLLSSVSDAEDMVQECWVKWQAIDHQTIENPKAFLTTILTNLCLDYLKSARKKRETYVGTWLPEPIVANPSSHADTPQDLTELADDVSFALLMTLERLSPEERAAFLLHDVFDLGFDEIANTLQKSSAATRKLASRARAKIRAEKPQTTIKPKLTDPLIEGFFKTLQSGDVVGFANFLADDAILYSDGGGKKSAALNPIYGRKNILAFFTGLLKKNPMPPPDAIQLVEVNGAPGLLLQTEPDTPEIWSFSWTKEGNIAALYVVRNPEKLRHVGI